MSGAISGRGRPGPRGPQGVQGERGEQGPAAFSLEIGDVSSVPYGDPPQIVNVGTAVDQLWNFQLPTGDTGVLSGEGLPTGSDGVSLGQLYYCRANGQYYCLYQLGEPGAGLNKWRPVMTQQDAIRQYDFDLVGIDAAASNAAVVGVMQIMFDDVERKATIGFRLHTASAIDVRQYIAVSTHQMKKMQADALMRGIVSLPISITKGMNSVTSEYTVDAMVLTTAQGQGVANEHHLHSIMQSTPGSGSTPGQRMAWDCGRIVNVVNDTGAPAATQYGNAPDPYPYGSDDLTAYWFYWSDAEYPVTMRADKVVEVPYA